MKKKYVNYGLILIWLLSVIEYFRAPLVSIKQSWTYIKDYSNEKLISFSVVVIIGILILLNFIIDLKNKKVNYINIIIVLTTIILVIMYLIFKSQNVWRI